MNPPLLSPPPDDDQVPLWNLYYQASCPPPRDPTIVWGTDVDCAELQADLRRMNADSEVLITPAHVLVRAVACALKQHPIFNRRIVRRRPRAYRDINLLMPFQKKVPPEADVMLFQQADRKSVQQIAREAWQNSQAAARGEYVCVREAIYMRLPRRVLRVLQPLHVWLVNTFEGHERDTNKRQRTASTVVNYLGFKGAAPLRSFKPSRFPYDSVTLSVTMGAIELRPAVVDRQLDIRPLAPLFVRADHRIADAHDLGRFTETLRRLIAQPAMLDDAAADSPAAS